MASKFVLRFDDIAPAMDWQKFEVFESLARELDLPVLVGVVPDCVDPKLSVGPAKVNFWDIVRSWSALGWTIAQHGHTHQYVTKNGGMFGVGRKSEFAGLPANQQFAALEAGKNIMVSEGVWQPVFMAPGHSLDLVTIALLARLGFQFITDGYGVYPYPVGELIAVPQLFSVPIHFGLGVYTICLHVNRMSDVEIQRMVAFVRENRQRFISFEQAATTKCAVPGAAAMARTTTSVVLRSIRGLRHSGVI
jgi:predicted deacetylase